MGWTDPVRPLGLYGGIRSVAITDSIQLGVYLVSAVAGIFIISNILDMSLLDVYRAIPDGRLNVFSTGLDGGWRGIFGSYNIFSGVIGGALLSFASHGTDHLIVQRILSCRDLPQPARQWYGAASSCFSSSALFLVWGLFIYVLLGGRSFDLPDTIMPYFIINHVPARVQGADAGGNICRGHVHDQLVDKFHFIVNGDGYPADLPGRNMPEKQVMISRLISLVWTCVMMLIAVFLQ